MDCRICGNSEGNRSYDVREMLFGTREVFRYFQCRECGCLQIAEIPADVSRHYPSSYMSFKPSLEKRFASPLRNFFRVRRYRFAVLGEGRLGRLLYTLAPKPKLRMLSLVPLRRLSRVLDVGCGTGELLYTLREIGMPNLLGVDAFVERTIEYPNGLRILKGTLADVTGEWDCVMMSCSLEHMPQQLETLRAVARLLSANGACLVRIPLVSSWAWEHYGVNWSSLDAPRHFYLHSAKSFGLVAERAGFRIERTLYESDDFQFRVSELYLRDIPLESGPREATRIFTRSQIRDWRRQARALNLAQRGDLATFYLRKK